MPHTASLHESNKLPGLEHVIGTTLRILRLQKGLTQEDLAIKAGLDRDFLSRLERGDRRPSVTTLFLLARALEMKTSDVVRAIEHQLEHP